MDAEILSLAGGTAICGPGATGGVVGILRHRDSGTPPGGNTGGADARGPGPVVITLSTAQMQANGRTGHDSSDP